MTQGINITSLRPEIQTLVNSDPTKYDPNGNGYIDDGEELSLLLSNYQCRKEDLTSSDKKTMFTLAEQSEISEAGQKAKNENSSSLKAPAIAIGSGVAIMGSFISTMLSKNGHILTHKKLSVEKLVADGSYTKGGRPAYDIHKYMKQEISDGATKNMESYPTFESIVHVNGNKASSYVRDLNGKPYILRNWKKGDPQFVKDGVKVIEKYVPLTKRVKQFGLAGLAIAAVGFVADYFIDSSAKNKAENEAKINIKAKQTADSEKIMSERRKQAEELRQRQEAMNQAELEYRENMQSATEAIDKHVSSAKTNAEQINKQLNEAKTKIDKIEKEEE
jgi:hypothetical protein